MSKWLISKQNWTPVLVADNTNFTDNGYMALQGGSSTQMILVDAIYIGGLATAQSPMSLIVALDGTVGASSLSGVNMIAGMRATAALAAPPNAFSVSTTKPTRSSSLVFKTPAFNAFGGITSFRALDPGDRLNILGNGANGGEMSLSAGNTGTAGAVSSDWSFEVL